MKYVFSDMTGTEFERIRDRLALTQTDMARMFGVETRTVRRWGSGESLVPVTTAMILRILLKYRIDPGAAFKIATGENL